MSGRYNSGYSSDKQRADNREMIELRLPLYAETEKAILVDEQSQCWLPKSQLGELSYEGAHVRFDCPRWLAEDRKLV